MTDIKTGYDYSNNNQHTQLHALFQLRHRKIIVVFNVQQKLSVENMVISQKKFVVKGKVIRAISHQKVTETNFKHNNFDNEK